MARAQNLDADLDFDGSNFELVVRKFVRCFIAVQNFKKFG